MFAISTVGYGDKPMLKLANICGVIIADIAREKLQMSVCDLKLEVRAHV
jgi:hypothetical protein